MIDPLGEPNPKEFSVKYPIDEMVRRATKKFKIHDRGIPMTSDAWGMFPVLVGRLRRFKNWKKQGVAAVKVFYDPTYFTRNAHTPHIMDPLHTFWVHKYVGFK